MAEGYLGDSEKTKEKFIDNWFVDNAKWVEADKRQRHGASRGAVSIKGPVTGYTAQATLASISLLELCVLLAALTLRSRSVVSGSSSTRSMAT